MTITQVNQLAQRVRDTPGYTQEGTKRFGSGYAMLVHEERTGWSQWVHRLEQWQEIATNGFHDTWMSK